LLRDRRRFRNQVYLRVSQKRGEHGTEDRPGGVRSEVEAGEIADAFGETGGREL
jgi:hypothetical protein